MTPRFGSVCSGIGAPEYAWRGLGWHCAFMSEIAVAPRAVLQHHFPGTPLHGDFTTIEAGRYEPIDLLVGGTPCQAFSVAGLRGGLADERGNLALEFLRLAGRLRPRWLLWENVPGVRSSGAGRDFGAFLGGLGELGYGWAYRSLDAQYAGLAQRRERVFVVGCLGDWRCAAAVLSLAEGLRWYPAPRREARERVAASLTRGADSAGQGGYAGRRREDDENLVAGTLSARNTAGGGLGTDFECNGGLQPVDIRNGTIGGEIAMTMQSAGSHGERGLSLHSLPCIATIAPPITSNPYGDHEAREGLLVFQAKASAHQSMVPNGDLSPGLGVGKADGLAIAHQLTRQHGVSEDGTGRGIPIIPAAGVRRLTPRECERLMGFEDDYTLVPYRGRMMSDGPRYQCLGNSMAVPELRWLGERIALHEAFS